VDRGSAPPPESGDRPEASEALVDAAAAVDPLEGDARLPEFFGPAWSTVHAYAELLRTHGVIRGVIGPQEVGRLWERHLLNSAAAVRFLPRSGTVIDLGSGGGLPGIVVAAMVPDVEVVLLEPMERRCEWLQFVLAELGLENAKVRRARAEEVAGDYQADAVTVRAVAPLDKLYGWAAPLVRADGRLVALKGERAPQEVDAARASARRLGWQGAEIVVSEVMAGVAPTRVVLAVRRGGGRRVR